MIGLGRNELIIVLFVILVPVLFFQFLKHRKNNPSKKKQNGMFPIVGGVVLVFILLTCFTSALGVVVLSLPGSSIMNASIVSPALYYLLWIVSISLIVYGGMQYNKSKKDNNLSTDNNVGKTNNLAEIEKAKSLLDSGAITEDEFNNIKKRHLE